ncbi:UDP-N-acetylmuramate--L-alanine ligase [Saccharicrinis carchari]|uniref:UDP-N-acetylmuramate--L-alanine ligase n=1 Tax=Saccharicrinis carchari TaxID=1168039 RepID=A0A521C439_SACCC|nr:UDP-N-acetylmuramate--L-alanine ligase [Saccharicrinis carchari]SMO54246.1 UDP-N-acetylmuramate--L-alanine ligase [Saccharicrinis carchari]
MDFKKINSVYFIGIGGIGMSALARYFKANGYAVAGYDLNPTLLTADMEKEGVDICFDDKVELIADEYRNQITTLVVYTPAIPANLKQLNYFKDNLFNVKKRSEVLGLLTHLQKGICVAGTHGKTTVSTMIAHLLKQSEVDCSAFLGGVSQNYKTNLLLSATSDFVVMEADEFDRSFLRLRPYLALITSADADHLDIYGDDTSVKESFREFAGLIKPGGILLSKKEIDLLFAVPDEVKHFSYSMDDSTADFYASNLHLIDGLYHFDLHTPQGLVTNITVGIPGLVNVENAIGACGAAYLAGVSEGAMRIAMPQFKGVRRRFEYRIKRDDLILIDDYAHHPEEIKATVTSVRALYPNKKLTGVFQPHLYSRTKDFHREFALSLSMLDELILLDIYPAREKPIVGVSAQMILDLVKLPVKVLSTKKELIEQIKNIKPEVLLMMGAGDIDKEIDKITESLK